MEWVSDPTVWIGLVTLVVLEIVLGIDNLIFIAILADKLPPAQRDRARVIGLSLALLMRLGLLASISWVMSLTAPLFSVLALEFSWRDLILILGGLFLIVKATTEIHDRLEPPGQAHGQDVAHAAFWPIVAQIVVLDAVFSLDSVITAVGMVDELEIMMAAVIIAVAAMLLASKPLTAFVIARPSLIILCLGFLLMIGLVLVVDGFGLHIPKGYVYAAIGFSVLIEVLNQLGVRNRRRRAAAQPPRQRIAEAVLRLVGGVPLRPDAAFAAPAGGAGAEADPAPDALMPLEKHMLRSVLTLAQRRVTTIMTGRADVAWLDATAGPARILEAVRASPHREFPVGRGRLEAIDGLVRKEDVLDLCLRGGPFDLAARVRAPKVVPGSASVLDALNHFKGTTDESALVVDEYGELLGLVTRADLLEAIAGDLPDAGDPTPIIALEDGALSVAGEAPVEDLLDQTGLRTLPPGDFGTAAGFALALFGRIPSSGERVQWDGWMVEVTAVDGHRITQLRLQPERAGG